MQKYKVALETRHNGQEQLEQLLAEEVKAEHVISYEIKDDREKPSICEHVLGYCWMDIAIAEEVIDATGGDYAEVGEYIAEFANDTDTKIEKLDIVALVYDYILQTVRDEVDTYIEENEIASDKLADSDIYVAGNYCATSYDGEGDQLEKAKAICEHIPESERDEMTKWFINQLS